MLRKFTHMLTGSELGLKNEKTPETEGYLSTKTE